MSGLSSIFSLTEHEERSSGYEQSQQTLGNVGAHRSINEVVIQQLKELYKSNVKPLERAYHYHIYKSEPLPDNYFDAKPMVLVLGERSTGKTTFIRHFLRREFPSDSGGEDSRRKFNILCYDNNDKIIPGHLAAADEELPTQGVKTLGNEFLANFQVSKMNAEVLHDICFIDTPPNASKFPRAVKFFAKKANRIIILFDENHLDPNTEFAKTLKIVRRYPHKIKVVLNKASNLPESHLLKAYGSLMWNMSHVFGSKTEMKIYVSNFPDTVKDFNRDHRCNDVFVADSDGLMDELLSLPIEHDLEKMNSVKNRAQFARLHARIMIYLKELFPKFFQKKSAKKEIITHLNEHLEKFAKDLNVPYKKISYMNTRDNRQRLLEDNLNNYKRNATKIFKRIDTLIHVAIPNLQTELSSEHLGIDYRQQLVELGLLKKTKRIKPLRRDSGHKSLRKSKFSSKSLDSSGTRKTRIFSISSFKSRVTRIGRKKRTKSRVFLRSRHSTSSPIFPAGSIADDAISAVSDTYSRPSNKLRATRTWWRKTGRNTRMASFEDDGYDHIDMYSIVSD